ncbi:hypothetical protein BDY19DRAFT_929266 [Irpex rosettiformis]|uniref:Uncharacterized protein n=1 Tax=Irpex rosettiformis TaxID=378272 RepID=A0ACB8UD82_9APHY|nr:hypothetical protein BDY19DRAFT_929266 [Irpex rosettiformis]
MTDKEIRLHDTVEDESQLSTPIAPHQHINSGEGVDRHDNDMETLHSYSTTTVSAPEDEHPHTDGARDDERLDIEPRAIMLPVPTSSSDNESSDVLTDGYPPTMLVALDALPLEAATAPINVGAGSRFVETPSATTARELKRLYDQHIGAGKGAPVRSPFVITAFTSQHGKQMYRVGRRDMDRAPRGDADDLDIGVGRVQSTSPERVGWYHAQTSAANAPNAKRRSRVSVYSFFKNGPAHPPTKTAPRQDGTRSPPARRLRKTRSIPNMASAADGNAVPAAATPTHAAGRPHAHSVSSVDAFRPTSLPPPVLEPAPKDTQQDYLASVMCWDTMPSSPLSSGSGLPSTRSFHSSSDRHRGFNGDDHLEDTIRYPFGHGISFDPPIRPSPSHLSSPPLLREMQSFESGLTARADPSPRTTRMGSLRGRRSDESISITDEEPKPEEDPKQESIVDPLPSITHVDDTLYTRYSTDLFEVVQNYKGLPVLDKVADIPDPPTIKLSLKSDNLAAPRDDPRFVIWGEVEGDQFDDALASRGAADFPSGHSSLPRSRGARDRASSAIVERPSSILTTTTEHPKRVLIAATIERWIAQLTSELNYDELLIFFLTYRTYVSALDLGHLLICRFHWALGEPRSSQDDTVRRIVRARTFIAIRYWLLTFFSTDFVPNRELRLLFANWLNNLRNDPVLQRHKDAPSIVQKLRKVALDCKEGHTRGQSSKKRSTEKTNTVTPASVDFSQGDFAENLRKAIGKPSEDTDIDLDFDSVPATGAEFVSNLNLSSSGTTAVDLAMMRQPLHLTYLQLGKQTAVAATGDVLPAQLPLPVPHSAISRVVVNAIGRLGRWKRVLNYRALNTRGAPVRPSLTMGSGCLDTSSFDLEANETGDLLLEQGGVEKYLKMFENQRKPHVGNTLIHSLAAPPPLGLLPPPSSASSMVSRTPRSSLEPLTETSDEGSSTEESHQQPPVRARSPSSRTSLASDSIRFRHSVSEADSTAKSPWEVEVVSIDDLDLSDLSSEDLHAPPPQSGLRKMGRRLPNRRDFELVRRSADSVSSMGIHSNHERDSVLSTGSSAVSSGPEMAGPIHEWQMTALVDSLSDDDEPGDVEAALKRLEGQINHDKQQHKQTKVDEWVKSINRTRHVNKGLNAGLRRYSSDEEDYGEVQHSLRDGGLDQLSRSHPSSRSSVGSAVSPVSAYPTQAAESTVPPGLDHSPSASNGGTAVQDVGAADPSSRMPKFSSSPSPSEKSPSLNIQSLALSLGSSAFVRPEKNLKRHRSFVLAYKSEVIVQHFCVIDRDLFLALKFEELVSPEWIHSAEEYNVLDWSAYVRERHTMKIEHHIVAPPLTVIRNRFNLTVNFVISEIALTHPSERVIIYSKFVRIAWKAYTLRNYHLLVAIIAGLDSSWVQRALKQTRAKKPPIWESRVHHDLRQWCSSQDDFKHIRAAVESLAEAKSRVVGSPEPSHQATIEPQSVTSRARAASEGKPLLPPSCVPFFGIYLSQLHRFNSLPDLIDPTAPHEPVGMDPETGVFDPLSHPEVFSYLAPLPPSVQLEPLINVQKQRLVAGVVKSFVSGQHLAIKAEFPVEKKLFQKCIKLRGLEPDTLQRVLALYSKWES